MPALAVAVAAVAAAPAGGCGCGETDIVGDVDADGDWADEADPDAWDTDTDTADSGVDVPDSPDETECLPCTSSPDPWVRVAATRPARIQNYPSIVWTGSEIGIAGGAFYDDEPAGGDYIYLERLSPETLGSGSAEPIGALEVGVRPSLAWNGARFGMVWELNHEAYWNELRFAQWNAAGLTPWPASVSAEYAWATDATIAWNGTRYGILWVDDAIGESAVRFAAANAWEETVEPATVVGGGGSSPTHPSMAWDGSGYGIAWADGSSMIKFTRVAEDGTITAAAGFTGFTGSLADGPSIAWTGSLFAVAWDTGAIYLSQVTRSGEQVGPNIRVSSSAGFWPTIAWDGCCLGVAWHQYRYYPSEPGKLIMFARVSPAGERFGAEIEVANLETWAWPREISMAWTGSEYAIAWGDYDHVDREEVAYVAMVSPCR